MVFLSFLHPPNSNLNVRYNAETDSIQILLDGEWVDSSLIAGLNRFYIFRNGKGMQNNISVSFTDGAKGVITENTISISSTDSWRTATFNFDCTNYIGRSKKLYLDLLLTASPVTQDRIGFSSSGTTWVNSTSSVQSLDGLLSANTRTKIAIDIDSHANATYKYITMTYYNKNVTIYDMYIE